MTLFEFGRDFYTDNPLQVKLAWEIGIAVIFLVIALIGYHMLRRAFGTPIYDSQAQPPPSSPRQFKRYELGARLYHWGNFLVMALLFLTGVAFFFPNLLFPLLAYVGFTWLLAHVVLGWIFIAFVLLHIFFSIFDTGLSQMWFHRGDGRELLRRSRYYLGGSSNFTKSAKYTVLQKIYHLLLVLFALVMIVTGISLFLNSEILLSIDGNWLRWYRILHDIFAFLFAAVIIGHIYLRLIKPRWPEFISMFSGQISRREFERTHDWRRWQPQAGDQPSVPVAQDDEKKGVSSHD